MGEDETIQKDKEGFNSGARDGKLLSTHRSICKSEVEQKRRDWLRLLA